MDYYAAVKMKDHSMDEPLMNARSIMLKKNQVTVDHVQYDIIFMKLKIKQNQEGVPCIWK